MSKSGVSIDILDLVNNPIKIAIWFEIMREDGITAKEISKRLDLKGTNIYYHLKHLKDNKLIISKSKVVPGTNLLEKTYNINKKFYESEERDLRLEFIDSPKKMRDVILFQLYLTAFVIGKQIMEISNMSTAEIKEQIDNKTLPFSKIVLCNEQDLKKATDLLTNSISSLDLIREGEDQAEYEKNAEYGILLGLVSMFK